MTISSEPTDPALETVTDLGEFHREDFSEPIAEGDIASALAPWQRPPPDHGPNYELFEATPEGPGEEEADPGAESVGVHTLWWVDSATGLPLRKVVEFGEGSAGTIIQRLYFDFDQTPPSAASLPASFFLEGPPEGVEETRRNVEDEPDEVEVVEEEE